MTMTDQTPEITHQTTPEIFSRDATQQRRPSFPLADAVFADAILTPVVAASDAARVLKTVAWFSNHLNRAVELLTVIDPTYDPAEVTSDLAAVTKRLGFLTDQPVRCRVVVDDDPANAMLAIARDRLVCMPTSAVPFKRHHFVESHAAALLERTTQPVILVGPSVGAESDVDFNDLLIALAGDEQCLSVLPVARQLADATGLKARLVHVLEDHDDHVIFDADKRRARLWFPDALHTSLRVDLVEGPDAADGLAALTAESLVVMATHARCGLARIAEGSIAFDTVADATAAVIVVGPHIGEEPAVTSRPVGQQRLRLAGPVSGVAAQVAAAAVSETPPDTIMYCPRQPEVRASHRFVVVLDATDRAAEALDPAIALAAQRGRDLVAVGVAPEWDETREARVQAQLTARGCDDVPLHMLSPAEMESELLCAARGGDVVVVSAFGTWKPGTRLYGLLGNLVSADAPAVVGIGPQVARSWSSSRSGPVVVCMDDSGNADSTIEDLHHFLSPETREVILLHVDEPRFRGERYVPGDFDRWTQTAAAIERRWGIPTAATTIVGAGVPDSITAYAASVNASLLVMASHHRPQPGRPTIASTSMTVVGYASCPVGILAASERDNAGSIDQPGQPV